MQYIYLFLTVLLVLLVMNGFLFLVLKQIVPRVGEQVNRRFLEELSIFDDLYEEKMKKLEALREQDSLYGNNIFEKKEKKENSVSVSTAGVSAVEVPVSKTTNKNFYQEYQYVKNKFRFDKDAVVNRIAAMEPSEEAKKARTAERILKKIPEKTFWEISTLDSDQQKELFSEVLEGEENSLLTAYDLEAAGRFSALAFRDYLFVIRRLYVDRITVYTSDRSYKPSDPKVKVVYDKTICEGIRVVRGNRQYDYSL